MPRRGKEACFLIASILFLSSAACAEPSPKSLDLIPTQEMLKSTAVPLGEKTEEQEGIIRISSKGYYKNLATTSRSIETKKPFFADLQRFRIEETVSIGDNLQVYAAFDNEMIVGDYLKAPDFDLVKQKDENNLNWLPVQWTLSTNKDGVYYTTYLYRGYIKYYDPRFQIIAGKQNINWGRCNFWSPMDLFNPDSPLDLERDERVGVDAADLNISITDSASVNLVYAPYGALKKSSFAAKGYCRVKDYDIFFMAGQFKDDNVIGACIDGTIGGASIRDECTYTWEHGGPIFFRNVVGIDYTFDNKLRMGAEYFFNGAGDSVDKNEFLTSYQYSTKKLTMKRNLIATQVGYDLTPLLKWDNYFIYDIDGRSIFFNPELKYNIRSNTDIRLGAQLFWGTETSEFGNYKDIYYAELKYYF